MVRVHQLVPSESRGAWLSSPTLEVGDRKFKSYLFDQHLVTEWLGSGLQTRLHQFKSGRDVQGLVA